MNDRPNNITDVCQNYNQRLITSFEVSARKTTRITFTNSITKKKPGYVPITIFKIDRKTK